MPTCWYVEECPFAHECTKPSWDRCRRCASYDGENAARKLLYTHCTKSSHHYGHTHEEVEEAVADAVILCCEVEDEEPQPPPEPLAPKRQRQNGSWQGNGSASSSGQAQMQTVSVIQPATVGVPQGEMITLPKTVLKAVFDCLDRAVSATKHAVKLSAAARGAFEEEVEKMTETREEAHKWINKV